jgi:hypothetical protein
MCRTYPYYHNREHQHVQGLSELTGRMPAAVVAQRTRARAEHRSLSGVRIPHRRRLVHHSGARIAPNDLHRRVIIACELVHAKFRRGKSITARILGCALPKLRSGHHKDSSSAFIQLLPRETCAPLPLFSLLVGEIPGASFITVRLALPVSPCPLSFPPLTPSCPHGNPTRSRTMPSSITPLKLKTGDSTANGEEFNRKERRIGTVSEMEGSFVGSQTPLDFLGTWIGKEFVASQEELEAMFPTVKKVFKKKLRASQNEGDRTEILVRGFQSQPFDGSWTYVVL